MEKQINEKNTKPNQTTLLKSSRLNFLFSENKGYQISAIFVPCERQETWIARNITVLHLLISVWLFYTIHAKKDRCVMYLSHITIGSFQVRRKHFGLREENIVKKQSAEIYLLSIFNRLSTVAISTHSFFSY